jgi:hypothetical protein
LHEDQLWYDDRTKRAAQSISRYGLTPDETMAFTRLAVRKLHETTVAEFRAKGITHVTLYRGQNRFRGVSQHDIDAKGTVNALVNMQPLNSFSTSVDVARGFGSNVVEITVPIENIFSTNLTGMGTGSEKEVVVIAENGTKSKIYSRYAAQSLK